MAFKVKLSILKESNELIKSIASGRKPTARCKPPVYARLTIAQSFLWLRNDNRDSVR